MVSKEDELFTQFLSTEDIIFTPYWGHLQCGHNQKNTDTEEKKGNTENTES